MSIDQLACCQDRSVSDQISVLVSKDVAVALLLETRRRIETDQGSGSNTVTVEKSCVKT